MMDDIERIKQAKKRRIERQTDERIAEVQKLLGENPNSRCKHCKRHPGIMDHAFDCALRKISPEVIRKSRIDADIELRKNCNRQRIFKSDKPRWNGLPAPKVKTMVRKRSTKNRGPVRELRHCSVCTRQMMFTIVQGTWRCHVCGHNKPCDYHPLSKNCAICYPKES